MLYPHVVAQARLVLVGLAAAVHLAHVLEARVALVHLHVLPHVRRVREHLATNATSKRFLTGVQPHVPLQI